MSKYRKCPHCKHKNLKDAVICAKCNRLIDGPQEERVVTIPEKEGNASGVILTFIRFFILFFFIALGGFYYYKSTNKIVPQKKDNFQETPFAKSIDSIKYLSSYQDNKLIPVKDYSSEKPYKLVDKQGQIVLSNISNYIADYNTFHIVTKNKNNSLYYYIVNNKGEILYQTKNKIQYFPTTNTWLIGKTLYYNKQIVNEHVNLDNTKDYNGYYFSYITDDEQGIIDYKGNVTYKSTPKEYNYFSLETTIIEPSEYENYCLINDNYNYLIINCKNGEVLVDNNNKKIFELAPNTFNINGQIIYINNQGEQVEYKPEGNEDLYYEILDNHKTIIDKSVYDNDTNTKVSLKDVELHSLKDKIVEKRLNIQKTYCLNIDKINFGLKYNNKEIIPCEYPDISYFSAAIMQHLYNNNKTYIIIYFDRGYHLFDVKNDAIVISNIIHYSKDSIFIEYKKDDKNYIYNIISDETIEVPTNTLVNLNSNYFMVEKFTADRNSTNREYYNSSFKNIYLGT